MHLDALDAVGLTLMAESIGLPRSDLGRCYCHDPHDKACPTHEGRVAYADALMLGALGNAAV